MKIKKIKILAGESAFKAEIGILEGVLKFSKRRGNWYSNSRGKEAASLRDTGNGYIFNNSGAEEKEFTYDALANLIYLSRLMKIHYLTEDMNETLQ